MLFDLATVLFYLFAGVVTASAVMVISARNPVHSVFFLILAFFNAAGLFVLIGAEYLAMTLVIVYVGAVAVLFLFVVMMLNVNVAELRQGFTRHLTLGLSVALLLLVEMAALFKHALQTAGAVAPAAQPIPPVADISNTRAIGEVLYTHYVYLFQVAGLVLLVAMIGAIVLTHRTRAGVRRQHIGRQLSRRVEDSMVVVKVKTGEGA